MNAPEIARLRERLVAEMVALTDEDRLGAAGQSVVQLDQQAVGRLSRMDALQGQAMARATQGRRNLQKQRILATLARIDNGEFGWCLECGEAIAPARLALDPCVPTCVTCAP